MTTFVYTIAIENCNDNIAIDNMAAHLQKPQFVGSKKQYCDSKPLQVTASTCTILSDYLLCTIACCINSTHLTLNTTNE